MNWFERYGIPGLYFVLLVTILCCIIFGFPYCKDQRDIAIKAFVAALPASVPIGYILVIFSQLLYYKVFSWWQVHREAWRLANVDDEEEREDEEWWVEARATVLARWRTSNEDKIKKGKWLQEWFAKRFDVLAINSALILATIFGWALVLLSRWFFQKPLIVDYCRIGVLLLISCLTVAVLVCSNCLLTKQARQVAAEYYRDLGEETKTQTSPNSDHVNQNTPS
jgi:hypothetical protein